MLINYKLFRGKHSMEKSYTKPQNEELFSWFNENDLLILKKYFKESMKLDYRKDKNGIMVKVITKNLMIIPEYDNDLLELLNTAVFFYIKNYKKDRLQILMWFRGKQ